MNTTDEVVTTTHSDEAVKHWLDSRAVVFSGPSKIPLAKINTKESLKNQARPEALTASVVAKYVEGMKHGDLFPPCVVYKRGDQYVVVDGNHRVAASTRFGATHIWAYTLDPKTVSETIELLTAEANARHGQTVTAEWRNRQAVYLVSLGHSVDVVANALVTSRTTVNNAISAVRADARAAALDLPGYDNIAQNMRVRLGTIKADKVFEAAVKLVVDTQFRNQAEVSKFVGEINREKTEADALERINELYEQRLWVLRQQEALRSTSGRKKKIANPKTQTLTAIGAVLALKPEELDRIFLTTDERSEVARRLEEASLRLMECEEVLRRA